MTVPYLFLGMMPNMLKPGEVAELLSGVMDGSTRVVLGSWQMLVLAGSMVLNTSRYWRTFYFRLCNDCSTQRTHHFTSFRTIREYTRAMLSNGGFETIHTLRSCLTLQDHLISTPSNMYGQNYRDVAIMMASTAPGHSYLPMSWAHGTIWEGPQDRCLSTVYALNLIIIWIIYYPNNH